MTFSFAVSAQILALCGYAAAQTYHNISGAGVGPVSDTVGEDVFIKANRNALNKTTVQFPGFDFNADPGSMNNATSSSKWSWNVGLSIINVDTNETDYPLSAAADSSSNLINIALSLDFPGGELPARNDSRWTLCANVMTAAWPANITRRALDDTGDCSATLSAPCLDAWRKAWQESMLDSDNSSGCPDPPHFDEIPECASQFSLTGYTAIGQSLLSWYSERGNRSSPTVGLQSGQIFGYEATETFTKSQAQAYYDEAVDMIRMTTLTFQPSEAFLANHSGVVNRGEVRTLCGVLNKDQVRKDIGAAPRLNGGGKAAIMASFVVALVVLLC